jgi:hypothetical protein
VAPPSLAAAALAAAACVDRKRGLAVLRAPGTLPLATSCDGLLTGVATVRGSSRALVRVVPVDPSREDVWHRELRILVEWAHFAVCVCAMSELVQCIRSAASCCVCVGVL